MEKINSLSCNLRNLVSAYFAPLSRLKATGINYKANLANKTVPVYRMPERFVWEIIVISPIIGYIVFAFVYLCFDIKFVLNFCAGRLVRFSPF